MPECPHCGAWLPRAWTIHECYGRFNPPIKPQYIAPPEDNDAPLEGSGPTIDEINEIRAERRARRGL